MISVSVVCVYRLRAYLRLCSSDDFSRNGFLRPFPPAWKYCWMVSRATSSTAHCFGERFFSIWNEFRLLGSSERLKR